MVESHRQEIAKLEALYASNPAGRVFVHLAEALRRAGEHERARSILEEGLARHPNSASGYVVLGRVLIDRGETEGAESAFRRVLELDGGNLVALRCLGDLARSGGRPTEAVVHYRDLIARNPASAVDSGLMRLLHEAQQGAADAAVAAAHAQEADEAAAAVADPDAGAAAAEEPSDTVAPGRVGPARPAEAEYGVIELDALPGDLASFAGLTSRESAGALEEPEPEAHSLEDDVVVLLESSAAPLELEELETELAASPAEVNLLSALPEPESPAETEMSLPLPSWMTDAPDLPREVEESAALEAEHGADAGDMDVDAAMLNLSGLSAATPFEIVPEATELTLVDDDSIRVAMNTAAEPGEIADADEALRALDRVEVADESVADEPTSAAADIRRAGDDARTQHPSDVADEAAVDSDEYQDLPWLVEPADAAGADFAGSGAGEDAPPLAETPAAATTDLTAESDTAFGFDLETGAAGDGALDVPPEVSDSDTDAAAAVSDAVMEPAASAPDADEYAVPFDVVDDAPVTLDLTGEFEGPAEQFAVDYEAAADSAPVAGEEVLDTAAFAALGERLEDEEAIPAFGETIEAAPDRGAAGEPGEAAAEFPPLDELVEAAPDLGLSPAEAAPEFAAFEELGEASEEVTTFGELAEPAPEFGAFTEARETAPDRAALAEAGEAEPDRARFAEDVEAEPDLATFMERLETGQEVAGFVTDAEPAGYDRAEDDADVARVVEGLAAEPHVTEYVEDVEAEAELGGYADEAEAEPDLARFDEGAEPEPELAAFTEPVDWLDDDLDETVTEPAAGAPAGSGSENAGLEPFAPSDEAARDRAWQDEIAATTATPSHTAGPGREDAVAAGASVTDLGTETLADLYLAQGFAQRAAEVYRSLLGDRPAEERLTAKLREAEAALARSRGPEPGEDAGDVWLRGVESAWTGGAGATGQETTPYAWTEREEREQGIGIGAYLRDLISWGTGEPARLADPDTERPDAAGEPAPADDSGAQPWGVSAEPESAPEPELWGAASEDAAAVEPGERAHEPEVEPTSADAWNMTAEPVLEETWSGTEPGESWSAPEEPPLDPWLAPEPTVVRNAPSEPVQRGTAANPVEEAFNEWFGPPPDAAAPVPSEPRSPAQARTEGQPGEPGEAAAEDDEDEDLEMFRAWLQSLKK